MRPPEEEDTRRSSLPTLPIDVTRVMSPDETGLDEDPESVAGKASSVSLAWEDGLGNVAGVDAGAAVREFLAYAGSFDHSREDIERKALHSMRVATLCVSLAREDTEDLRCYGPAGDDDGKGRLDLGIAFATGLLHDVGRLPQHAMHRSYSDVATGCDHGDLGAEMLGECGLLGRFLPGAERSVSDVVIRSVRWHNKRELPDDIGEDTLPYASLVRDADITDILSLWAAGRMSVAPRPVRWEDVSPGVLRAIREGRTVSRADVQGEDDEIVAKAALAWAMSGTGRRHVATWAEKIRI